MGLLGSLAQNVQALWNLPAAVHSLEHIVQDLSDSLARGECTLQTNNKDLAKGLNRLQADDEEVAKGLNSVMRLHLIDQWISKAGVKAGNPNANVFVLVIYVILAALFFASAACFVFSR